MVDVKRVTRATLTTQLEDAIRVDIIEGALSPGQRLRASDLTERYGVSATPLREALQRLAAQNLVEIDPRLGATVSDISVSDLRDIYFLRELLEGIALERSLARADDAWEARVRETWATFRRVTAARTDPITQEQAMAWSAAHRAFHEALFAACESPWLLRFVGILADHSERYRMLSVRRGTRDTLEEHHEIYEPALARDPIRAVPALRRHLAATVGLLAEGIEAAVPPPTDAPAEPAPA